MRAQVTELQAQLARTEQAAAARPARRRVGWRGPVATLLIVLGCVLAPLSVLAVWTSNQVSNTDRYVQNVAPLISQPSVQRALTDKVSAEISTQLNVQALTKQAAAELSKQGLTRLGTILSTFSGSIASGVDGFIHSTVAKIVASPQVAKVWVQGNRFAHTELVKALSGQSSALSVSNGQVVLGLGPLIDQVKRDLAARGLTIVNSLPPINPTFPLFSAKYLVQAQSVYRLLNTLKWVLPIVALICFAAGVYIARRHRRALVGVGLGLAASMLVLGIALAIGRTVYLNSIPSSVLPADAAAVVFDTLIRYIKDGLRMVLVVGLLIAIAAFFSGSSVTAVKTRHGFRVGFAAIRGTGERAGVSTGAFGAWVYRYRTLLRVAALTVAVLVFIFWSQPSAVVALVIALILLVVIGLIELLGRPPAQEAAEAGGPVAQSGGPVAQAGGPVAQAGGPVAQAAGQVPPPAGPAASQPQEQAGQPGSVSKPGSASTSAAADPDAGSRNGVAPRRSGR